MLPRDNLTMRWAVVGAVGLELAEFRSTLPDD